MPYRGLIKPRILDRLQKFFDFRGAPDFEVGETVHPVFNINEFYEPVYALGTSTYQAAVWNSTVACADPSVPTVHQIHDYGNGAIFNRAVFTNIPAGVPFKLRLQIIYVGAGNAPGGSMQIRNGVTAVKYLLNRYAPTSAGADQPFIYDSGWMMHPDLELNVFFNWAANTATYDSIIDCFLLPSSYAQSD